MIDFATELHALIEKHREFPGADLFEMGKTLLTAAQQVYKDRMVEGPFRRGLETEDI